MLNRLPSCFLYTDDPALVRTVTAHVKYLADVQCIQKTDDLLLLLKQFDPALLLLDLRTDVARDHLPAIFKDNPDALVLAFGTPRSVPAQNAEAMGAYAVIELSVERQRLQTLVRHALDHLRLIDQNRLLKLQVERAASSLATAPASWPPPPTAAELFAQAFRFFDNPDMMFDTMAHGIITGAKVSRVVFFAHSEDDDVYYYRAGVNGLRHTLDIVVTADSPFVRHLRLHAHVISRTRLDSLPDPSAAAFLKQALDSMGAEVIIPMQAHQSLIGWVAVGHRITGMPFSPQDIENLVPLADQVAVALSNQLLFTRTSLQKALAESVFHAMPVGVVAVEMQGRIHWINRTGANLFGVEPEAVLRQPASRLSSHLCDLLLHCIQDESAAGTVEWDHPPGGQPLQVSLRRMMSDGQCVGALAVLRDISQERKVRLKEVELERQSFWTGLAAAMSHEIRNPLVAISTFAQLLPERYSDPEFRDQFSKLVSQEVGRLNGIVNQISDFAEHHPPTLKPVSMEVIVNKAIEAIASDFHGRVPPIEQQAVDPLPMIQGDMHALVNAFSDILRNAVEATATQADPRIRIESTVLTAADQTRTLRMTISDNGPGIPDAIRGEVFSPFCTTKPRGIGVGLSVARRTLIDHGGTIAVPACNAGCRVDVTLPIA